jgi:transcriptional regulator with XRE-family HTH domain
MRGDEEFGSLLRTFRARLRPEAAGVRLVESGIRRVPGLRRDELAGLAGVSEEHLKRLEQGRRRPSRPMVDALARALRLERHEHERLRLVAGFAAPGTPLMPREITAPARRLLDRVAEVPTCVCDASWTVLDGNRGWMDLNCGGPLPDRHERNVAWRLFTSAPTAVLRSPDFLSEFQSSVVADLRTATRRYPADPGLRRLVTDLRAASAEFVRLWSLSDSGRYHPDRITIQRPSRSPLQLDKDVLTIEPGDLRVVVFTVAA